MVEILNDGRYRVWIFNHSAYGWSYFYDYGLLTDLTAIEKPFGLLSKEVQDELKAVNNGKNIQFFSGDTWVSCESGWVFGYNTYRLDPKWKAEEVKEMTVADIEKLVGKKVRIVK